MEARRQLQTLNMEEEQRPRKANDKEEIDDQSWMSTGGQRETKEVRVDDEREKRRLTIDAGWYQVDLEDS
jgi:hypothetical protein